MKRVRIRFSISTLLVLMSVLAVVAALEARRWRIRKSIVTAIQQHRGLAWGQATGPEWLRALVGDEGCFLVVTHVLFGPEFAGYDSNAPAGDAEVRAALEPIPAGTRLEILGLNRTLITDESLQVASKLRPKRLNLEGTDVSDKGLEYVGTMRSLEELRLGSANVSDDGLRQLAGLRNLQELHLEKTIVSEIGLESLGDLPALEVLVLDGTRVSDKAIPVLASMKELKVVAIRDTLVTAEGITTLRKLMPTCKFAY